MSKEWLLARAPGFAALPENDLEVIVDFVFLWSLFEARVMDHRARGRDISAKVDEWQAADFLEPEAYDDELAYLRHRYFANGEFTHHFHTLNFHDAEQRAFVAAVIDETDNDPRNRVVAVLLIVWRFRNNLFHGEKWEYGLEGQFENFTCANGILMRLLERHGELA
jgi:hypothetical protein